MAGAVYRLEVACGDLLIANLSMCNDGYWRDCELGRPKPNLGQRDSPLVIIIKSPILRLQIIKCRGSFLEEMPS